MRINREQFNKWVKALRSGRYKQAKGSLQHEDGYCCLGVACKVIIPKNKLKYKYNNLLKGGFPFSQPNAPKWLKEIDNDFRNRNEDKSSLSFLNDDRNYTFEQIADALVEAYPERKKKNVSNKRVVK